MIQPTFLNADDETMLARLIRLKAAGVVNGLVEATATGNPVSFSTEVAKPLKSLVIPFSPVQSGSGDPAPDNVRPISGFTGVNISRTGKNLYDGTFPSLSSYLYYRHYYVGGFSKVTGSSNVPLSTQGYGNLFLLPGKVSTGASTGGNNITDGVSRTVSPVDGWVTIVYRNNYDVNPADYNVQIEPGESASAFESYSGETIPVSWQTEAGEVYGGELDAVSGVLSVEWYKLTLTGAQNYFTNTTYIKSDAFDMYIVASEASRDSNGIYSNQLKKSTAYIYSSTGHPNECMKSGRAVHFNVANDLLGITDYTQETMQTATEKMKAYLAELYNNGNPIEFALPLETPQTVQLDPVTLSTLIGTNTLWTDTNGTNEVTYLKKKG